MKKLFSLLIVFISIKCLGQVYQVLPQYGYEMKRVNATLVLLLPSDTTNNKTGVARIGTVLYIGNGTKWTASTVTDATKLNISDTASMLTPYAKTIVVNTKLNISDTAAMLSNYAKTSAVNLKVNIADTAAMLTNYAKTSAVNSGLALKVNISDTASMLTNYAKTSVVNSGLALKVNISDTATMLSPYAKTSVVNSGLALKVNIADTAAMLTNYAKTSAVNSAVALKVNISDTATMLTPYAKVILVNTKVNISDTAAMLANYAKTSAVNSAVALKVNISDTATMLTPYLRKIDTASLSNRINLKADINSPTFTGTVGGITQSMVGLGNVTNESKATMFTNATFTGTFATAAGAIGNAALANSAVANLSGTNTGDQTTITGNAGTATALQTAITIGTTTGDATSAGSSFDGTANNTNALTLATVNSNVGSFGSATQSPTYTVNGKGLLTAAANVTITPAVGSITGLGTGVATALGVNTGSAGAVVLFNGNAGTPSALIGTNITGTASLNINGTVGATTATTGAFTTATASTSLRTPLLIGGTTTTSTITYQPTSGVGTTGADHIFKVGNNGATEAMRILNNANVGIGTTPTGVNGKLQVLGSIGLSGNSEIRQNTNTDGNTLKILATQLVVAPVNSAGYNYTGGGVMAAVSVNDAVLLFDAGYTTSTFGRFKVSNTTSSNVSLSLEKNSVTTLFASTNGTVGVGTATPAASSILDVTSTTKGFLPPRMTTTEINAIASPAAGLVVYNTTLAVLCFYDGTGWKKVSHSPM
jgi:hypothetical protein